jgi:hemolysin activation/secretion protein
MTIKSRRNFTFHQAQQAFQWLSAKISHALYSVALSLCFLLSTPLLHAATSSTSPPGTADAGQILQQIERDLQVNPLPKLPEVQAPEPVIEDTQVEKVVIKQFKFSGNHLLSGDDLQAALAPLTNVSITIAELKTCPDLIAALYQKKGFLAIATLPEQDITEGVVLIEVVEAVFGDVKFNGTYNKDFKRIRPTVIEGFINAKSPKGEAINQVKIDRALALLQRLSGFAVESSYQSGQVEHSTDLLIKVIDQPMLAFNFSADNSGGRSTGKNKGTATIDVASPLKLGDLLNFTALHTEGTDYARVAYSLPVGSGGLKLSANTSYMTYKFIKPMEGSDLTPLGHSITYNVNANYPIILSNNKSLSVEVGYEKKYFLNQMSSASPITTES